MNDSKYERENQQITGEAEESLMCSSSIQIKTLRKLVAEIYKSMNHLGVSWKEPHMDNLSIPNLCKLPTNNTHDLRYKQGISLSEICAPPWKVKTFMVTRWDLQSKFRWSLTAWTMLFTTTLALLVKRKYFILNLIGRQRVIPCTSDSKQFN